MSSFSATTVVQATANTILASALLCGTGSNFSLSHVDGWQKYVETRVPFDIQIANNTFKEKNLNVKTSAEHIENIRNIFNASISDIAVIFGVNSRQAVYKWLNGESNPETDKQEKIFKISEIADQFRNANIVRANSLLKMKAFHGKSLMDFLITGENTQSHVDALIKEAKIMEASYEKANISASKAKSTEDWKTSFAIPGSFERT